jgi:hypothetical protein
LATAAASEEDPGYDDAALQESYQAAQTGSAAPVAAPSSSWLSPYLNEALTPPHHHRRVRKMPNLFLINNTLSGFQQQVWD